MHLSNKSLLFLISPFIVSGGVWLFSDLLVEKLALFFEPATQQQPSVLQQQGEDYRYIATHRDEYASLLNKVILRNENRFWISERLYQHYTALANVTSNGQSALLQPPPPLLQFGEGNITAVTPVAWSVQMVLPQQNMAIVNNRIMRVGQRIDGVKLLNVESTKVYIQTEKGSQWVKLFH